MIKPVPLLLMAFGLTAACENALPTAEPDQRFRHAPPPRQGPRREVAGARNVSPAVVETVTEQILVQPAEIMVDGSVTRPAVYKTETRQAIVRERVETWFETPCAAALTPEFVATLQRALKARGFYRGQISGRMDTRTRAAVRQYQAPQGLNSGILSLQQRHEN